MRGTILATSLGVALMVMPIPLLRSASRPSNRLAQLGKVLMVSPTAGWAIGVDGAYRTIDGGVLWSPVGPPNFRKKSGNCPIGEDGHTWHSATSSFATGPGRAWLAAVCMLGPQQLARHITVWRTDNGGRTWRSTTVSIPETATDAGELMLDFVSPTVGWMATEYDSGSPPSVSGLWETHNSGGLWKNVPIAGNFPFLLGFASTTRAYGFRAAPDLGASCCNLSNFANFPYVTQNGAANWTHQEVPVPAGYKDAYVQVSAAGFSGAESAAIPVSVSEPNVSGFCTTYHTNNGGIRWWHTSLNRQVCGMYYFDAAHGWGWGNVVKGQPTTLYRTLDGGSRWVSLGRSKFASTGDFYFVTPSDGFGYSYSGPRRGLVRTTDGGSTWRPITPRLSG